MIKIVHSLAFKFDSMALDYVPREENSIADKLSKEGSKNILSLDGAPYKFFFNVQYKARDSVKIK